MSLVWIAAIAAVLWWVNRSDDQSPTTSTSTATTQASAHPSTANDGDAKAPTTQVGSSPTTQRRTTTSTTYRRTSTTARRTTTTRRSSGLPSSGLPSIAVDDLPKQAQRVIDLIESDGPFPYDRDGVVFQNRERILPPHDRGWYHEYTVPTPGENDRGARRLVTGNDGRLFYTDDHYESFYEVDGGFNAP